jgi:hypothetical protein
MENAAKGTSSVTLFHARWPAIAGRSGDSDAIDFAELLLKIAPSF